jgi:hypothetical protein
MQRSRPGSIIWHGEMYSNLVPVQSRKLSIPCFESARNAYRYRYICLYLGRKHRRICHMMYTIRSDTLLLCLDGYGQMEFTR